MPHKRQFTRAKRICSTTEYDKHKEKMIKKFVERGYDEKEICKVAEEVKKEDIGRIEPIQKGKKEQVKFISKYDGHAGLIKKCINKHWELLICDPKYGYLFKETPLYMSTKKGKSLSSSLTHSDILPKKTTRQQFLKSRKNGTYPCLGCQNCNSIINPLRTESVLALMTKPFF